MLEGRILSKAAIHCDLGRDGISLLLPILSTLKVLLLRKQLLSLCGQNLPSLVSLFSSVGQRNQMS